MITTITSINDIQKIIRTTLIKQSELPADLVINALSNFGVDLDKYDEDSNLSTTLKNADKMLLFEVKTDDTKGVEIIEKDDTISDFTYFKVHIIMYGNDAMFICKKIKARLLTDNVIVNLHEQGIHVENVSNIDSIHEFINDVIRLRADFDITIACRLSFTQLNVNNTFNDNNVDVNINTN